MPVASWQVNFCKSLYGDTVVLSDNQYYLLLLKSRKSCPFGSLKHFYRSTVLEQTSLTVCFPPNQLSSPFWHWSAVKSIKKQHLVEVRSMANPPAAVKLALESICLLLGESTTDWKQIRSIIMRENFIPTIVNFSAEEIR